MAGQFRSVRGVRDWSGFQRAVSDVLRSSARLAPPGGSPAPMAVLVQAELAPSCAGVLFGVEPVTGDRRRLLMEAVHGSPHGLVSGTVTAARYVTTRRGRLVEPAEERVLDGIQRRRLARLGLRGRTGLRTAPGHRVGLRRPGDLWLLQSRPVTATGQRAAAHGRLLGPGPVSETFPHPLRPLEVDLWVAPLHGGITEALRLAGAASRHQLAKWPVLMTVGGRIAVHRLPGREALRCGGARRCAGITWPQVGPALPADGILPSRGATRPVTPDRLSPRTTTRSPVLVGLALALGAVVAFQGIALVADATQSRPDPHPEPTTLEVDVWVRDGRSATEEATRLSFATLERVRASVVAVSVRPTGGVEPPSQEEHRDEGLLSSRSWDIRPVWVIGRIRMFKVTDKSNRPRSQP